MSSEKILQKISEKDIKENLTEEQYTEYLKNEKIEKLGAAKPYIKQDFLSFVQYVWPEFIEGSHHKIINKNLMTSLRGKLKD